MLRPESVLIIHVHLVENRNIIDIKNNPSVHVSETDGLLFHYKKLQVNQNTTVSSLRMREFADVIQERVESEIKYFKNNICLTQDCQPSLNLRSSGFFT